MSTNPPLFSVQVVQLLCNFLWQSRRSLRGLSALWLLQVKGLHMEVTVNSNPTLVLSNSNLYPCSSLTMFRSEAVSLPSH